MRNVYPYAAGLALLGAVSAIFFSFALQWQPVPKALADSAPLIAASAAVLGLTGALLVIPRTTTVGGGLAGAIFLLWVLALHLPQVAAQPASVVAWLGVAEIFALSLAGVLWLVRTRAQNRLRRILVVAFGLCALVFGLSHFVYAAFTATMVPSWLPVPLFWAYATGAGHALAGIALIAGRVDRLAATLLTAMCASFVVLVHLPRVIATPASHAEWTALAIALSLTGAVWVVRSSLGEAKAADARVGV